MADQQAQLHMHIEAGEAKEPKVLEEVHQLLNVSLMQGDALPDNWAYLDGCSTMTAFKTDKYLKDIKMLPHGIKINYNTGAVVTNKMGSFGRMNVWYIPNRIANIFSMHKLEKHY
jgi:hypothetical protein